MHPIFKVLTALLVIALIADAAFIGYLQFTGRGFTAVREAVTEESAAEEQPLPEISPLPEEEIYFYHLCINFSCVSLLAQANIQKDRSNSNFWIQF